MNSQEVLNLRIEQFEKFYNSLTRLSPKDYIPWFFPCDKKNKNPSPQAIYKIDSSSKGSWHHQSARLSKEQCIEHIKAGYNIGISARTGDPLIIGDIDEAEYLEQLPTDTLTSTSRKRAGGHFFGWDKDGSAKVNIPTDYGEMRSNNQYVLSPGSYVPFNLESEKDKKAFDKLPQEAKDDEYLGFYTVRNPISPIEMGFEDLPLFFREREQENESFEDLKEDEKEKKEFNGEGKYTELFNLKVSDIVGKIPSNQRSGHPLHESDTDANFSLTNDGCLGQCWRHTVSLNAVQYLCVKARYSKCNDAGTPHKQIGISKRSSRLKGDKKAFEIAYKEAIKLGLIKEYKERKVSGNIQMQVIQLLLQKNRTEATETIVQEFYKNNYIKVSRDDHNPEFKIYKNGIYINEGKTYIGEYVREILGKSHSTQLLNDVIIKIKDDNVVDFEKLEADRDPYLLATEECLIDLRTGKTKDFSPDIIMFNKIPVKYDIKAKCPKILKFLSEILETEEDIKLIAEIIGFSLVNEYFMEKAIMFLGNGRNGKSKLLQLMKTFFGVENTCSVRLQEMNTQSTSICELHNRFVNLAGDLSNSSLKDSGLFKETTGRDTIQAKRKYKNDLKFVNSATHIFACNELPRVYDTSRGFWERWVLVDFPYTFIDEEEYNKLSEDERNNKKIRNPDIIRDILSSEELSGLLNLALEGLKRIKEKKHFTYSKNAEEVRNAWIRQADSFQAFSMDNLEEDYNNQIEKNELRKIYYKYCRKHRLKTSSDIAIKIALQNNYGCIEVRPISSDPWMWEGVRIKKKGQMNLKKIVKSKGCKGFPTYREKKFTGQTQTPLQTLQNGIKMLKNNPKTSFSPYQLSIPIKNLQELAEQGIIFEESKGNWRWLE